MFSEKCYPYYPRDLPLYRHNCVCSFDYRYVIRVYSMFPSFIFFHEFSPISQCERAPGSCWRGGESFTSSTTLPPWPRSREVIRTYRTRRGSCTLSTRGRRARRQTSGSTTSGPRRTRPTTRRGTPRYGGRCGARAAGSCPDRGVLRALSRSWAIVTSAHGSWRQMAPTLPGSVLASVRSS